MKNNKTLNNELGIIIIASTLVLFIGANLFTKVLEIFVNIVR